MFNGSSAYELNGNSFANLGHHADQLINPVAPWKGGVSQAAMIRGTGVV